MVVVDAENTVASKVEAGNVARDDVVGDGLAEAQQAVFFAERQEMALETVNIAGRQFTNQHARPLVGGNRRACDVGRVVRGSHGVFLEYSLVRRLDCATQKNYTRMAR